MTMTTLDDDDRDDFDSDDDGDPRWTGPFYRRPSSDWLIGLAWFCNALGVIDPETVSCV